MKLSIEDVLFINKQFNEKYKNVIKLSNNEETITVENDIIRYLIIDEFSGNNFQLYINYFKENYNDCLKNSTKNIKKSLKARNKGNALLLESNHNTEIHEDIWKLYTKSIALAPRNSEELAFAYGNRSYLLLHFNKYNDCIKDIDRAIAITKSDALKIKLLCRKMTCLKALHENDKKKDVWYAIQSQYRKMDPLLKNEKLMKLIKQSKSDLLYDKPDSFIYPKKITVPFANDAVAIKNNGKYDRYLVAARNIEPGEMVMAEKPYVTSVNHNKFYSYCSHCLSLTWSNIPCDYCCLSMFCSEECKLEAWEEYHHIECKIIPFIQFNHVLHYYFQLSIKAIIMSVKKAGSISKLKEQFEIINNSNKCNTKLKNNDNFSSYSFLNVLSLPYKCNYKLLIQYAKNTCFLLVIIICASDFLGKNLKLIKKELVNNEEILFICIFILKLIMVAASNPGNIDIGSYECIKQKSFFDCVNSRCCSRGASVSIFGTFINNNCNPNVIKCFTDDGKIIYFCYQPIKKNKQIFVSYFNHFFKVEKIMRQKLMSIGGYIICNCKACTEDWPIIDDLFICFKNNAKKLRSKQSTIAPKILSKYKQLLDYKKYQLDEKILLEITKDVTEVVKVCGQPFFLTCLLTDILNSIFVRLYGTTLDIPGKC